MYNMIKLRSDEIFDRHGCGVQMYGLAEVVLVVSHTSYTVLLISLCIFLLVISEPSPPNPTSEMAPSSRAPAETEIPPSDPSRSPGPATLEKETQRDGEMDVAPEQETEEEKAIRLLYCSLCKVAVNSASQLQAHNIGEKLQP